MTPDQALSQRRAGLAEANRIRSYRKQLKLDVKRGNKHVLALLADAPDELLTMKVWDLLLAAPKVGRTRVTRWLRTAGVPTSATIAALTDRQRTQLTQLLASQRIVGYCSACCGPLVRLAVDGEFASCDCGESSIPEAVIEACRSMAA